jgi:hypothetical protein
MCQTKLTQIQNLRQHLYKCQKNLNTQYGVVKNIISIKQEQVFELATQLSKFF